MTKPYPRGVAVTPAGKRVIMCTNKDYDWAVVVYKPLVGSTTRVLRFYAFDYIYANAGQQDWAMTSKLGFYANRFAMGKGDHIAMVRKYPFPIKQMIREIDWRTDGPH